MLLRRRIGRVTRMVDVPLCAECARHLVYRSADEERVERLGMLAGGIVALLMLGLVLLMMPPDVVLWWRLLAGLLAAGLAGTAVFLRFRRASFNAALPEKKAVLNAVQIVDFSWRATTFEFVNAQFAEQFRRLNEAILMDV
ncbi:MAG: hypothetical protein D6706_03710 [Chloroflexi bacterium]|nr:MAG: hypothetical protein D6706_03710 [Chloroflexota bacterium]